MRQSNRRISTDATAILVGAIVAVAGIGTFAYVEIHGFKNED
jgi:hypothetical protein